MGAVTPILDQSSTGLPIPAASRFRLNPRWRSLEDLIDAYPEGLMVDLGCGFVKPEGFVGLDDLSGRGVQVADGSNAPDVFCNLNEDPFPLPDQSCREVRSSHFLEHSVLDHALEESWRILKPGGTLMFAVPYANSAEGMYPGHNIFLTDKWFDENINFQKRFAIVEKQFFPSDYWKQLPRAVRLVIPFDFARKFLFNACWQMLIVARRK